MMNRLALYGGEKTKTTPFGTGARFGGAELNNLREALEQNTLFYWFGNQVKQPGSLPGCMTCPTAWRLHRERRRFTWRSACAA